MFPGSVGRLTDTFLSNLFTGTFEVHGHFFLKMFTGTFEVHGHFFGFTGTFLGSRGRFFSKVHGQLQMFTGTFAKLFKGTLSRFTGKKKTLGINIYYIYEPRGRGPDLQSVFQKSVFFFPVNLEKVPVNNFAKVPVNI